jgi:hypothetical protein
VAVCAAGLSAGPGVGVVVTVFVTWMAVAYDGRPVGPIGVSMLCGGLAGGWLYRWRPRLAQHPLTGFCLTATVSSLRDGLTLLCAPGALAGVQMAIAPVLQGFGTALTHLSQLEGSGTREGAPEVHRGQKVCTTGAMF